MDIEEFRRRKDLVLPHVGVSARMLILDLIKEAEKQQQVNERYKEALKYYSSLEPIEKFDGYWDISHFAKDALNEK